MYRLPKVWLAVVGVGFILGVGQVKASEVLVSEIQVAGQNGTNDEFVELYNPSGSDVNLTGWRLGRFNSGGTYGNLVASMSGMIKAKGYYLVAHTSYSGVPSADAFYSALSNALTNNYSVVLYSDAGMTQVDLVGMGTNTASEGAVVANPPANGSVERKALNTSTLASMVPGGLDALEGNGEDTNNNNVDFVVRPQSEPQNTNNKESLGGGNGTVSVMLSGGQEVPGSTSSATGVATVKIDTSEDTLTFALSYQNLMGAEIMAGVYGPAAVGNNASLMWPMPAGSPKDGIYKYAAASESDILNNLYYLNIATYPFPDGEIRGQMIFTAPSPTPEPTATNTPIPTPTNTPVPTPTTDSDQPTPTANPSPTPGGTGFYWPKVVCATYHISMRMFNRVFLIPYRVCRLVRYG